MCIFLTAITKQLINSSSCFKPGIHSGKMPAPLTSATCHHPQQLVGKVTWNMEGNDYHLLSNVLALVRGLEVHQSG
jgi:hypothetical protein